MAGVGLKITAQDYNDLQSEVELILGTSNSGTSTAQFGYGQTVRSSQVDTSNKVTASDIANLRIDLVNINVHQTGSVPVDAVGSGNLTSVTEDEKIRFDATDFPLDQYVPFIANVKTNRFDIASGFQQTEGIDSVSRTWEGGADVWGVSDTGIETVIDLTWPTSAEARHYFNSGGKIQFNSSRSGGTETGDAQTIASQNNNWTTFLRDVVGTQQFGGNTSPLDFYQLTNSYQTFVDLNQSGAYSASYFQIAARTPDEANNNDGNADRIEFRIRWIDDHVPQFDSPVDGVDGTIELNFISLEPIQTLLPTGNWTVTTPSLNNTPEITSVDPP